MIQPFDRNVATLIMGMGAPIMIQIAQWKDLLEFLKEKQVIKLDVVASSIAMSTTTSAIETQLRYLVLVEFAVVFAEEAQYGINKIHKFERESHFPWEYDNSVKAELKYFGYSDADILPPTTAENLFDDM